MQRSPGARRNGNRPTRTDPPAATGDTGIPEAAPVVAGAADGAGGSETAVARDAAPAVRKGGGTPSPGTGGSGSAAPGSAAAGIADGTESPKAVASDGATGGGSAGFSGNSEAAGSRDTATGEPGESRTRGTAAAVATDGGPAEVTTPPGAAIAEATAADPEGVPRLDRFAIGQVVFGVVSVAVGVAALVDAAGLAKFGKSGQPGPGLFPDLIAALLVVLGIWLTVLTLVRPVRAEPKEDDETVDPRGFRRVVTVWLAFVVSIPLLVLVGFAPAMAALVAFLVFGVERIRGFRPVLAVVLVPALVYLLFSVVLGVELPESILFPV